MPDNEILKTISENIFPTGDHNKRVYTKNKEGILSRFTLSIDPEPYDLRKENDYLGKMIFNFSTPPFESQESKKKKKKTIFLIQ